MIHTPAFFPTVVFVMLNVFWALKFLIVAGSRSTMSSKSHVCPQHISRQAAGGTAVRDILQPPQLHLKEQRGCEAVAVVLQGEHL